jgi:hypothetical protein
MREPPVSGINYPLLLAVVALHVALFAWTLQPAPLRPDPRPRSAAKAPAAPPPVLAQPAPASTPADDESIAEASDSRDATDPRRAFSPQQWRSNHDAAALAQDRQRFGERLPSSKASTQSLDALEQGMRRGERDAATAAAELHDDCSDLDSAAAPPELDAELLRGLDAASQALARASLEARVQRLAQRQQRCAAWREAKQRLDAARRAYAGSATADAFEALRTQQQLDPPTPDLLTRLREGLRALWESQSQTRVGRALVLQLLSDDGAAQNEAGLRLLLQLAERDDSQVEFAASVLARGFGNLAPQPALADAWQKRAAELGADAAIDAQLARDDTPPAQDWAWHAWRVWLNAHGCYVDAPRPDDAVLLGDLRALQQLDASMSPGERAAAGQRYLELTQRLGERARRVRLCTAEPDSAPR